MLRLAKTSAVMLLAVCSLVNAQEQRTATLVGIVTDPTGAVVPSANITVTNTGTQFVSRSATNAEGAYYVPFLAVGDYELAAEAAGFKKYVQSGISLSAGSMPRINITLQVGATSDVVEVTAAAPLLATESAVVGNVLNSKPINEIPIVQEKAIRILYYMQGVVPMNGYHFLGLPEQQLGYSIDGVPAKTSIRSTLGDTNNVSMPALDSFAEVKAWTTGTPAEIGQAGGGMLNFTFKSGTNQLHGSLEDRYTSKDMLHRSFFEQANRTAPFTFHTGQGSLSGPIVIPKLYNGRNKSFFFLSYAITFNAEDDPSTGTTPDNNMLNGNFAFGGLGYPVYDPRSITCTLANGCPSSTGWTATVFPGAQIPVSRFDPVAKKFLSYNPYVPANLPGSNTATGPTGNLLTFNHYKSNRKSYSAKFDQQVGPNHKFFVRWTWNNHRQFGRNSVQYAWTQLDSASFGGGLREPIDEQNAAFSEYWTVSPTIMNELRVGFNRRLDTVTPYLNNQGWAGALGIPGVGPQTFPQFNLGTSVPYNVTPGNGLTRTENEDFTFQDNMTRVSGKHTFKWGYQGIRTRENNVLGALPSGTYSFTTAGTALPFTPNTGNAFASFLLGAVTSANYTTALTTWLPRWWTHAAYFQDDFKLTPRLTLSLGVRYSFETPFQTKYGQKSQFSPTTVDPISGLMGAIVHPKGTVYANDSNNFAPRIGVAWNFQPKWVFRGSFGVFTNDMLATGGQEEYIAQYFSQQAPGNPLPAFYLSQGPGPFAYKMNSDGSAAFAGTSYTSRNATYLDPNLKVPYTMTWSTGLQWEFRPNWLAELDYQGTAGVGLTSAVNMNVLPQSIYQSKDTTLLNQVYAATQNYLRFPQFGAVNWTSNFGHSTYNGLTSRLEHRFSGGLQYTFDYTWSKSLAGGAGTGWQFYNWGLTKGPTLFDIRDRVVSNLSYQLPVGKGRHFRNKGGWLNQIIGGWNFLWIQTVQSGSAITFSMSGSPNKYLPGQTQPDRVPGVDIQTQNWSIGNNVFPQSAQSQFFNIKAFAYPSAFTGGNAGVGIGRAGHLWFPQYSLSKTWEYRERIKFRLRVDTFNIPVKPWFSAPNSVVNLTSPQLFGTFTPATQGNFSGLGTPNGYFALVYRVEW